MLILAFSILVHDRENRPNVREDRCYKTTFSKWLDSEDGQLSEEALFAVMDSLEGCSVDPRQKVIVFDDGERLSINETVRRIHNQSRLSLDKIESLVIGWLQMHYEPQGLSEQQMEKFENLIDARIQDYHNSP